MVQRNQPGHGRVDRPTVSDGYLDEIARILKDRSAVAEINQMFRLADADPGWQVEPETDFHQVRARLVLGWFQGIRQHAPGQLIRITRNVVQQMLDRPNLPSVEERRILEVMLVRLNDLAVQEVEVQDDPDLAVAELRRVFVAHGHEPSWSRLVLSIRDTWNVEVSYFESENRVARAIPEVIAEMTGVDGVAVIIMTSEDQMASGQMRARQNVIHEAGMSQAALGFERVALLI